MENNNPLPGESTPTAAESATGAALTPARKSFMRSLPVKTLRLAVIAYATLFAFAWLAGESQIFHPQPPSYRDSNELLKLTTADGQTIAAIFYNTPGAKYAVLYSHGNAEDLGYAAPAMEHLAHMGFAVLGYEYHGYGHSTGKPSEQAAYADIDAAYAWLTNVRKIPPERIILYGRSVGGGPSTDLAARQPVGGLILESAFTSAFRVVTRVPLLPFDHFRNLAKIPKVKCPVLIIHGREDEVVPFHHGQSLFQAANEPRQCLWIDGGKHNSIPPQAQAGIGAALRNFVSLLDSRRP